MLKTVENFNFNRKINSRCAEIHYSTYEFSIVCLSCQQIWEKYDQFIQHYKEYHALSTNLDNVGNSQLHSSLHIQQTDNLYFKTGNEYINVQQEQWLLETLIEEEINEEPEISTVYNGTDNSLSEHEISSFECQRHKDTNYEKGSISKHAEDNASDIDWTQSYAPKLLKSNERRTYKPRNQPNQCSYCGKIFRRRYQLDTHLNIHTGLKPHQCDVCGRQFRATNTLQRHLNTHSKRETYHCKYCDKEFAHRAAHVSHETRHTQERRVPCQECGKLFYTLNQLDTHKRKMHNVLDDNKLPYICDLCCKRYRSASMLSTHKFKKHYRTAKFVCDQCDKRFIGQKQLDEHMNIHLIKNAS